MTATRASAMLNLLEQSWRGPLGGASLVAEVNASDDEIREALRALGQLYRTAQDTRVEHRLLHANFPACVVVALAGIGALDYIHGNYWTGVWAQADMNPQLDDQGVWGRAFRAGLDRFHLARFFGLPQVNVGEIMMHAGIPLYCLADFLTLLLQRQERDPATNAASILAWATAPDHNSRLSSVDKPVQRFLRFGGDYAEDVVDRSLDLLDRLREPSFDPDGLGLPARIVKRACSLAEDGSLDLVRRRRTTARSAREQPRLVLEPFSAGLVISLPPVPDAPNGLAVWHVHIDGAAHVVHSRSPWPGAAETAPAADLAIAAPAGQALISLTATGGEWEIDIVDHDDPLLIFAEDGRRVPPKADLPPEPVWLLHPDAAELAGARIEVRGGHTECDEAPVPYGWEGWRLRRFDFGDGAEVRLGTGPWRSVRGARRARLDLPPPVLDATTIENLPVHAARPRVGLPADPGVATAWSIRVRRPEAMTPLVAFDVTIDADAWIDPWKGLAPPLVGTYELTVRGPLGRGLRRVVAIIEGLSTQATPRWRELSWAGLSPTTLTATSTIAALRLDSPVVRLGADEVAAQFTASGPDRSEVVMVTPPHMAVQRITAGVPSQWSCRPLQLAVESLDGDALAVRLPAPIPAELVVRSAGTDVQVVHQESTGGQALARFTLGRIADTVQRRGSAQLDVRLETKRFPVARCEPLRLAQGIMLDGNGRLMLSGARPIDGLTAACYQIYAPWRAPEIVAVEPDLSTPPLPENLRRGGPFVVLLRIEDPWLPAPWPRWPGHENAFEVIGGAWAAAESHGGASDLSGVLAGAATEPGAGAVPFAGLLYQRADDIKRHVQADVRQLSARILGAHPRETLLSVASGDLVGTDAAAPLVHAGLGALPVQTYVEPDDELRLWAISPLAAVLASAHALGASDALRDRVVTTCGPVADVLLRGEADPFGRAGTFDGAERFTALPPAQMDVIWRAAAVVPRGLLSADERAAAARELFDRRRRPGVERVARGTQTHMAELTELIRRFGNPAAIAAVWSRGGKEGWTALPSLSVALAIAARLAARNPRLRGVVEHFVPIHATLARHAPRLVTVDLVLAELLLSGADI